MKIKIRPNVYRVRFWNRGIVVGWIINSECGRLKNIEVDKIEGTAKIESQITKAKNGHIEIEFSKFCIKTIDGKRTIEFVK